MIFHPPRRLKSTCGRLLTTLPVLWVLLVVGGCRTVVDPAVIRDAQTAAQVKTALVNDPTIGPRTIEVTISGGVVRLSGTVQTQAEADRAATLARSIQGVRGVEVNLQVGTAAAPGSSRLEPPPSGEVAEVQDDPRLLAVGVTFGWTEPSRATLGGRATIGPLVRIGAGQGFGPALALGWFDTAVRASEDPSDARSSIHVRPLMAGVGYTLASDRVSIAPSIVGGVAFNSVSVPTTGGADRIAVEVTNSFVWRPGVSMWVDLNRRAALNVSAGYAVTGLRVTFLENGRLVQQDVRGDTAIVHAGVAYKLF